MGVYIKGMEKPKCCGACLLCLDDSRIANGYCMIFHRCVHMAELDKNCPLVEVKTPHGRLVDTTTAYQDTMQYGEHFRKSVLRIINDLPTVIEVEGE